MSVPQFQHAAVVLGMHRSGTSALAGLLRLAGLGMPRTLLPPSSGNEKGLWESEAIKSFNEDVLRDLGSSWHGVEAISLSTLSRPAIGRIRKTAKAILAEEYGGLAAIALKDPRLCRLLPLWQPVLSDLSVRTTYSIILRNPLEVAQSLSRRNEFDPDLGALLWARYLLDAEAATRGSQRIFLTFDSLLSDWLTEITRIGSKLALPFDPSLIDAERVGEFLQSGLRHHRIADEQVFVELQTIPQVSEVYRILLGWAQDPFESEVDYKALDRIRHDLDRAGALVASVAERARLDRKRLAKAVGELAQSKRASDDLEAVKATLAQQSTAQARLEQRLDGAVASLSVALSKRLTLEGVAKEAIEAQRLVQGQLDRLREDAGRAAAAHDQELKSARETIEALERKRNQETRELTERLEVLAQEHKDLETERNQETRELTERLEVLAQEHKDLETERNQETRELTERLEVLAQERKDLETERNQETRELTERLEVLAQEHKDLETERNQETRELTERLEVLAQERKDLETELKDVKRKYRSTQHQLARDQEKLRKWKTRSENLEVTIAQMRQTFAWRISAKAAALLENFRSLARRAIGGGDRKLREQIAQVRRSPQFDARWYLLRYADVAGSGIDPALHYVQNGWREGRDPGPEFSTSSYLKANPDVAQSGRNPLLHYTEFGHSEGRSVSGRSKIATDPPALSCNTEFGAAAACESFEVSQQMPVRWARSARLRSERTNLISIGSLDIGYTSDSASLASVREAFDRLSRLSGYSDGASAGGSGETIGAAQLIDAWLTGDGRLRSRWNAEPQGLVVRAYQHVVENIGALELVGEALLRSDIDFVDARLRNQLFPVLLVFSDPIGAIRGTTLLAFPSLCRGGLHYPELLALSKEVDGEPVDILTWSRSLADELSRLLDGEAKPLIGGIVLNLSGGDGAERLFQSDLRSWLQKVMRVGVDPERTKGNQRNGDYLAEAARLEGVRENAAGKLSLATNMIPAISALVAAQGAGDPVEGDVILPILIAGSDPSAPATLVQMPVVGTDILRANAPNYPSPWCRFSPVKACRLGGPVPIGAIREHSRLPVDAELLTPVAQPIRIVPPTRNAISWLIAVDDDNSEDQVAQTLEALSLQVVSTPPAVVLIGDVASETYALARNLFDDRAAIIPDVAVALAKVESSLVGYVASDVILHDDRTAQVLASILEDPSALSASCVIVATEKRGKGWHVSIADQGLIPGDSGTADASGSRLFWRANYPAAWPPRDLWVGRTSDVRGWLQRAGPLQAREGMHVCTSLVSAAYLSESRDRVPLLRPPVAQSAMRLEPAL